MDIFLKINQTLVMVLILYLVLDLYGLRPKVDSFNVLGGLVVLLNLILWPIYWLLLIWS